jgi:hypothetical protein
VAYGEIKKRRMKKKLPIQTSGRKILMIELEKLLRKDYQKEKRFLKV